MSRFDALVSEALLSRPDLVGLRAAVEKELLHHDILREMGQAGLLRDMVFIGGTCLRLCYGSPRLSEDLDFTTAIDPDVIPGHLSRLARTLEGSLHEKYQLPVEVSDPKHEAGLVRTWKVRITTRPERPDLPAQRIHIDVQALPARDPQPMLPRNPYRVEMGTAGLILSASSLAEILADKLIAIALRSNRIKWRDLWDVAWLVQHDVAVSRSLIEQKAADRGRSLATIAKLVADRVTAAAGDRASFIGEIERFLPPGELRDAAADPRHWEYLMRLVPTLVRPISSSPR
ncbi:MAG: nucleotidyl transferase AbiEii/AbiGii toxin family protein [Spirochaetaceae bacterium]|nr:MAG: nucleotidyl transferase AbiEii/AbiGii toxin family protein [Spirochaetaceae bacterium]